MRFPRVREVLAALLLAAAALPVSAQEQQDSLVTLISAKSARIIEERGQSFRKVIGPAKFLHNNTYLLCDTALWNVTTNIIDAVGHVQIIQNRTRLKSETLQYVVDEDLAKFRGSLVELVDKDQNTLRTRHLDYNTKDSVAVFQGGASMRDKDGQIIESRYGTYDSKENLFVFNSDVNMFSDTTFVKTSRLEYRTDLNLATFGFGTDVWHDDNMLSANAGWYDRGREIFFFRRNVHILTKDQESWSDSLYFYRVTSDLDMLGHAVIVDTTRNAVALAGRIEYTDSLSQLRMTRRPALMGISEESGRRDTTWVGGDSLYYRSFMMFQLPSTFQSDSDKKLKDISGDPISEYRRKAAEAAAKAAEEAAKNDPNRPPDVAGKGKEAGDTARDDEIPDEPVPDAATALVDRARAALSDKAPEPPVDSLKTALPDSLGTVPVDSLSISAAVDSLRTVPADSLGTALVDTLSTALPDSLATATAPVDTPAEILEEAPTQDEPLTIPEEGTPAASDSTAVAPPEIPQLDSTKVAMVWAVSSVKVFRRDMQASCDSLIFNDRDSLVRLYRDPLVFNEGNRQYASDSIYAVIRNKAVRKAHLIGNAFITTQEDTISYDQIRGAEMVAYFDSTSTEATTLTRYDALGGASAIFFLMENDVLATVNKVEAKMLYGEFVNGELDKMYYFEGAKNDAYPIVQLPRDERQLKGFRWDPDRRPTSPGDITDLKPRKSERTRYLARPHAKFAYTDDYFPGYLNRIYREIAVRDSLEVVRRREEAWRKAHPELFDTVEVVVGDSLALADTLSISLPDSLGGVPVDSLGTKVSPSDSTFVVPKDSLGVAQSDTLIVLTPGNNGSATLTPAEQKALEKKRKEEEKARIKAEKQAAREAKWAEEDLRYEQKQAAKAQRKLERERARKLRALRRLERKAQREKALLEKYIEQERRRQERKAGKSS